jgi:hypothetical protein
MADADFDGFYGRIAPDQSSAKASGAKAQTYVRIAGAVVSLALVAGFAVWGYRLAVRDVRGVPVIQALEGPMRVAPDDPGGEIADHQGLAVNNVAAAGVAAPVPDRLVLAPRPVELTEEDVPGLGGVAPPGPVPALAPLPEPGVAEVALAAAPQTESASPTEIAIDAALAEALGEIPLEEVAPAVAAAVEPIPDGALVVSPRPKARPASRSAPEPAAAVAVDAPDEIDPSTIPAGTRLVQFGAFDTQDEARAEWVRLSGQFGELMDGKGMVLQPAESGGRTFYRLRAHGFDGEDDARRFCSAFVAQNATCIPVPQR